MESTPVYPRHLRISPENRAAELIRFGGNVLRATTTSTIIRAMRGRTPPFRLLCVGRVFRDKPPDPKHYPIFHQVSGAHVGAQINGEEELEHLRQVLERLTRAGQVVAAEHQYPFVRTRGWELYVKQGRRRQNLAGAGLLLPEIVQEAGYNPKQFQAFAFGLGLEAPVIWRIKLPDIRTLWQPPYVAEEPGT